jgi:DNA-binding LacI/PurR family transcriptional regulator
MRSSTRSTLKEIAKYCGVSHTTVSMVINNSERISKETRQKVLDAIQKFNYRPNLVARSLVTSRTNNIGIFGTMFDSPYYNEIIRGIEMESRNGRMDLKIYNCNGSLDEFNEIYDRILGERRIDVVIALSVPMERKVMEQFEAEHLPVIILEPILDLGNLIDTIPTIHVEGEFGLYQATKYLISLGHRQIGLVNGPSYMQFCQERLQGYQRALKEAKMNFSEKNIFFSELKPDPFTMEAGFKATQLLLAQNPELTAICCISDTMAIGVVKAIRKEGKEIPRDISVIGFDDTYVARLSDPALTTLHQPLLEIGKLAVQLAYKTIQQAKMEKHQYQFKPELIIRESTAPPR